MKVYLVISRWDVDPGSWPAAYEEEVLTGFVLRQKAEEPLTRLNTDPTPLKEYSSAPHLNNREYRIDELEIDETRE